MNFRIMIQLIPRFALVCLFYLTILTAQEPDDSAVTVVAEGQLDSVDDDRLSALQDSIAVLHAQLQVSGDSLAIKSDQYKDSVVKSASQAEGIGALTDSIASMAAALVKVVQHADSLALLQEAMAADNQVKADQISALTATHDSVLTAQTAAYKRLADSLSVTEVLRKAGAASTRRQIIEISALQDSLAVQREFGQDIKSRYDSLSTLSDSLRVVLAQSYDSLTTLGLLHAATLARGQQQLSRIGGLADSLSSSLEREGDLQGRHQTLIEFKDSLGAELTQAKSALVVADSVEQSLHDAIAALQVLFGELERQVSAGSGKLAGIHDQLKTAIRAANAEKIDGTVDGQYLLYLQTLVDYQAIGGRRAGRLFGGGESDEMTLYKSDEFRYYLQWAELQGRTADALNLLAGRYYAQKDEIRGALTYIKTLFLYNGSPAAQFAIERLTELKPKEREIEALFQTVAQEGESMRVGKEQVYRYLYFLDMIRQLENRTALHYFLEQAIQYMSIYPDVFGADKLHTWIAQTYHKLGEYNIELLALIKIRTLYPESEYIPQTTYMLAEVTSNDLAQHELGAERYALFLEEFPNHDLSPRAMMAQSALLEGKLKQPELARELYRKLATTYSSDDLAPVALSRLAQLLQKKLKSPAEALSIYQELLSKYGDVASHGIVALNGLAKLSAKSKQYDVAVDHYQDIYKRYPAAKTEVIAGMLAAADIYEADLKNLDGAIRTLQVILDQYPNYGKIKAVQNRVSKLEKKRN